MNTTPDKLPETIPLKTAAQISGRSVTTIRRWIREGKLDDKRPAGSSRCSPIKVDTVQLRAFLATLEVGQEQTIHKTVHKTNQPVSKVETNGEVLALKNHIEMLEIFNKDVRAERDKFFLKLESQESELEALRKFRRTAMVKIEKLETENRTLREEKTKAKYGVRGLLKGAIKKLKR